MVREVSETVQERSETPTKWAPRGPTREPEEANIVSILWESVYVYVCLQCCFVFKASKMAIQASQIAPRSPKRLP